MRTASFTLSLLLALASTLPAAAQTREEKVRADRLKIQEDGFWIYNDLPRAFAEAKRANKPMIVVLRCVPCEECVKLDDDLVDKDPVLRPLLDQFVRVRQVSTNGLDLGLFQYDTDQSFAVFFLNGDGTIYGRFGTRSHRTEWLKDVSVQGLAEAMKGALALHEQFPAVKSSLAGKRGEPLEVASPELYPALKDKFTNKLNFEGNVVRSCIHCHQIGEAQRAFYTDQDKTIPEHILYPFPHPKDIGLILDPHRKADVLEVAPGSPAANAGLKEGDQIVSLNGQPMLSIADVQWVLHRTPPEGGRVQVALRRGGDDKQLDLDLKANWRRAGDISWRVTSWTYRRMVTGGLKLEPAPPETRQALQLGEGQMGLLVNYVGQYGPHAAAKQAGFRKGDVILSYDGRTNLMTDSDLLAYGIMNWRPNEKFPVVIARDGKRQTLELPFQK
ncbi:MAG: PDZ domain-containing protein [Planctomycetales bacterium]|nr:PDZ domain-containing protein [Planctomycetales bacterium]